MYIRVSYRGEGGTLGSFPPPPHPQRISLHPPANACTCTTSRSTTTAAQRTVHLPHGLHEVVRVLETDKAVAFGLLGVPIPDDLGLQEAGELGEGPCEGVVIYIVTEVATEDSEVIWGIGRSTFALCTCT